MRRIAAAVVLATLAPFTAFAQQIQIPTQSTTNPNIVIAPAPQGEQSLDKARRISRDEATKLVKEKKAVFVDVRSKESYDAGHIKGAISIPESELLRRLREIPPKTMIITYCA
jgi:3-mercaptopyruvate sulfurtransferase SseA